MGQRLRKDNKPHIDIKRGDTSSVSKVLFDEQPIVIDRVLAQKIGLNEAIIIQQVHYWLKVNEAKNQNFRDGRYWTYNSIKLWQEENFSFWSLDTVKRTFSSLVTKGVFLTGNYNHDRRDRTTWYTIDYDKLQAITASESISAKCTNALADTPEVDKKEGGDHQCISAKCTNAKVQNAPMQKGNLHRPLPETSTEISTETSNKSFKKRERAAKAATLPQAEGKMDFTQKGKSDKPLIYKAFEDYPDVKVTEEEYKKLIDTIGAKTTHELIASLQDYILNYPAKAAKYKSHAATIRSWDRRDKKAREERQEDKKQEQAAKPGFTNYSGQRQYDYDDIEKRLLGWDKQ